MSEPLIMMVVYCGIFWKNYIMVWEYNFIIIASITWIAIMSLISIIAKRKDIKHQHIDDFEII